MNRLRIGEGREVNQKGFLNLAKRWGKNEDGAILVIVAISLVALLGCMALVTDVGLMYRQRVLLVNAVDAAALAGAQEMALKNTAGTSNVAKFYATQNLPNINDEDVAVNIDTTNRQVSVTANKDVDFYFARVLGFYNTNISATATAGYEYPTKISQIKNGNVLPLFLTKEHYNKCLDNLGDIDEDVILELMGSTNHFVKVNNVVVSGNWGALDFGGGEFENALKGTLDKSLSIKAGDWYQDGTKTGTMGVNVEKAVDYRLEDNGILDYGLIPIVSEVQDKGGGKVEVFVTGFAIFQITGTVKDPPGWSITGHLKDGIVSSDFMDSSTEEESFYGSKIVRLVS